MNRNITSKHLFYIVLFIFIGFQVWFTINRNKRSEIIYNRISELISDQSGHKIEKKEFLLLLTKHAYVEGYNAALLNQHYDSTWLIISDNYKKYLDDIYGE